MSAPIPELGKFFITGGRQYRYCKHDQEDLQELVGSIVAALEAQLAEVEEYLPPESPAYQSMGERAKLLKDQMQYAAESSGELERALAALEAQAATAIAMRDSEERNKIDFIQQLERSEAQNRQLEAMRTHCENCGADYMATGIEAGCPCLLQARNRQLVEALKECRVVLITDNGYREDSKSVLDIDVAIAAAELKETK